MKHDKKHKKNKSPKRNKKSKKTDRKEKKHKHKQKKKTSKKLEKALNSSEEIQANIASAAQDADDYCGPSIDLMNRAKCPETKAEYDHRQNQIKRVVDQETGRIRLIKGDGEILEEIVPRERHKQINQEATRNDGASFQKNTVGLARK